MERRRVDPVFIGGAPCLDFANTVWWRSRSSPWETLPDYAAFVAWCAQSGLLDLALADRLGLRAAMEPELATRAWGSALELREAINQVFAVTPGNQRDARALQTLSAHLEAGMANARVFERDARVVWTWPEETANLDLPVWMLARNAVELLTGGDARRVHRCAGDGCGWLFLDASRNGTRRWCDKRTCGNRANVRAHYGRVHAG